MTLEEVKISIKVKAEKIAAQPQVSMVEPLLLHVEVNNGCYYCQSKATKS